MVKSLYKMLLSLNSEFGEFIKKNIHQEIEKFAHTSLADIHAHVLKKKKASATYVKKKKEKEKERKKKKKKKKQISSKPN